MPCYDSRSSPDNVRAEAKKEFQADLDKLTRLLCEATRIIHRTQNMSLASEELFKWHLGHLSLDVEREKKAYARYGGCTCMGHNECDFCQVRDGRKQ